MAYLIASCLVPYFFACVPEDTHSILRDDLQSSLQLQNYGNNVLKTPWSSSIVSYKTNFLQIPFQEQALTLDSL